MFKNHYMKNYTYKDWWEGKICLNTCRIVVEKGVKSIPVVSPSIFLKEDFLKIKQKQKELFFKGKNLILKKLNRNIKNRYKNSKLKNDFLVSSINRCKEILFGKIISKEKFTLLEKWSQSFDSKELIKIHQYATEILLNGRKNNFNFIHSPNCSLQDKDLIPAPLYAQAIYEHYNWLKTLINGGAKKLAPKNKNYSAKEIAIAYFCLGSPSITKENAGQILKTHSNYTSAENLIQNKISKTSQINTLTKNHAADTKHLKSLEKAKLLINSVKSSKVIVDIDAIIADFKAKQDFFY